MITITCKHCGKKISFRPQKPGVYKISCPACQQPISVQVNPDVLAKSLENDRILAAKKAAAQQAAAPAPAHNQWQIPTPEQVPAPVQAPAHNQWAPPTPAQPATPTPPPMPAQGINVMNAETPTQDPRGHVPTQALANPKTRKLGPAQLVQVGTFFNTNFRLHPGEITIGREDATDPSEISIKGDHCVSRRSLTLVVNRDEMMGYTYRLKINKATNPVLLNGTALDARYDEPFLSYGDILVVGKTKLRLDPLK